MLHSALVGGITMVLIFRYGNIILGLLGIGVMIHFIGPLFGFGLPPTLTVEAVRSEPFMRNGVSSAFSRIQVIKVTNPDETEYKMVSIQCGEAHMRAVNGIKPLSTQTYGFEVATDGTFSPVCKATSTMTGEAGRPVEYKEVHTNAQVF